MGGKSLTSSLGDDVYDVRAQLSAELAELRPIEVLDVHWVVDSILQHRAIWSELEPAIAEQNANMPQVAHFFYPVECLAKAGSSLSDVAYFLPAYTMSFWLPLK